jgi:hypothetical protein
VSVLRVVDSFVGFDKNGIQRQLFKGQLVDASDTIVKGREHLFEPVEAAVDNEGRRRKVATG